MVQMSHLFLKLTLSLTMIAVVPGLGAPQPISESSSTKFRLAGGNEEHGSASILLPVFVEGRGPYPFLLDTGSMRTMISERVARSLDVDVYDSEESYSAHGSIDVSYGWVKSLQVGDARVKYMKVGVSRALDEMLSGALGESIGGTLGHNFLRDFEITLDFADTLVHFRRVDESDLGDSEEDPKIPLRIADASENPIMLVEVEINGEGPYTFILDTGASLSLISPALAELHGIAARERAPVPNLPDARFGNVSSVGIGESQIEDLRVVIGDLFDPISVALGEEIHGIIGFNFLCQFRVTLNYPESSLKLGQLDS